MDMGTHMTPSYANLFMGHLEQDFLDSELNKPGLWLRFIDDLLLLWPHGADSLTIFFQWLNSLYPAHFAWNTSPSHVTFLDINACIDRDKFCTLSVSNQPASNYNSTTTVAILYQPSHIPLPLAGRYICSHPDNLHTYTSNLIKAFTSYGFPVSLIQKQLFRVFHHSTIPCFPSLKSHLPICLPGTLPISCFSPLLNIHASNGC